MTYNSYILSSSDSIRYIIFVFSILACSHPLHYTDAIMFRISFSLCYTKGYIQYGFYWSEDFSSLPDVKKPTIRVFQMVCVCGLLQHSTHSHSRQFMTFSPTTRNMYYVTNERWNAKFSIWNFGLKQRDVRKLKKICWLYYYFAHWSLFFFTQIEY